MQRLVEASIAAGDDAGARRLFSELSAVGGSSGARTTEALAALAAAHGVRHEAGIKASRSFWKAHQCLDVPGCTGYALRCTGQGDCRLAPRVCFVA